MFKQCLLTIVVINLLFCEGQELSFVVLGDWGGTSEFAPTSDTQLAVANGLGAVAQAVSSKFVISTGDNFYDTGVTDVYDPRFSDTFERVYTHPALNTPWYIVAGNRDHYGNVTAELAYTDRTDTSRRWQFPALNYERYFQITSTKTLHVIFIDTWDLTTQSHSAINPPDVDKGTAALTFLENALRNSTGTWRIVVTHYPIYSAGSHGPFDRELQFFIEPILIKYRPDAYFCGHDHSEQHVVVNGINYFVIGGGSEVTLNQNGLSGLPTGALSFMYPSEPNHDKGGFASVTVTETNMTVVIYNSNQKVLYSISLSPPQSERPVPPPPPPAPAQPIRILKPVGSDSGYKFCSLLLLAFFCGVTNFLLM